MENFNKDNILIKEIQNKFGFVVGLKKIVKLAGFRSWIGH